MSGLVSGGWNFVWAAYGITTLLLGAYALRTFTSSHHARITVR